MRNWCAILLLTLLAAAGWIWWTHDALVRERERVDAAWAQVRNARKRRDDLLPSLLEITRASLAHERRLLGEVSAGRESPDAPTGTAARMADLRRLDSNVVILLEIAESHPALANDRRFASLRHELLGTENRIAVERSRYDEAVRAYRTRLRSWPSSIVAALGGFSAPSFYASSAD